MGAEETITVAKVSEGDAAGRPVELPVLDVLTGRAFLTGKSGSGKSNSISVVAENLLEEGFGLLVVDVEGEYYGLKEEYEVLHAGADEECDIRVSEEHAEKLATLALEQNVPIILDLSGFLEAGEAEALLTAVARQLFAKGKKVKQPFLLVVEEIHEYVPEGGGMGECGRMLVKVAKRGRKHGLGIAGISQRPADVKKDFITQCDWLVWHRLTWQNDTRVVKRVLGSEYAEAIEDLDDGEGFLRADWDDRVRRVQFDRKRTFDAGATPGLEDFERPDLKSVSDDLVDELRDISDEQARREDRIADLEAALEEREQRIAELEAELSEARDLSRMAEQFARAMTREARAGFAAREETNGAATARENPDPGEGSEQVEGADAAADPEPGDAPAAESPTSGDKGDPDDERSPAIADLPEPQRAIVEDAVRAHEEGTPDGGGSALVDGGTVSTNGDQPDTGAAGDTGGFALHPAPAERGSGSSERNSGSADASTGSDDVATGADDRPGGVDASDGGFEFGPNPVGDGSGTRSDDAAVDDEPVQSVDDDSPKGVGDGSPENTDDRADTAEEWGFVTPEIQAAEPDEAGPGREQKETGGGEETEARGGGRTDRTGESPTVPPALRERVESLTETQRAMLSRYRTVGPARPESVHEAVGGSGGRAEAYRHNHRLRSAGFVTHVGQGRYTDALPALVERCCEEADDGRRAAVHRAVEDLLA